LKNQCFGLPKAVRQEIVSEMDTFVILRCQFLPDVAYQNLFFKWSIFHRVIQNRLKWTFLKHTVV